MVTVRCDVKRVKERKEVRTLCRKEEAVKQNVIKITDHRNVKIQNGGVIIILQII